jgi:PAS domain S-box-containing protein
VLGKLNAAWGRLVELDNLKKRSRKTTSPSTKPTIRSIREELQEIDGLLVTMAVIFGLVGVLWHNINIFYLPLVLVLAVMFAAFVGGTIQGLLSAALASVFLCFYLFAFRQGPREWLGSALVWSAVLGAVALITGYLQGRAREKEFQPWKGDVAPFMMASESLPDLAVVLLDGKTRVTTWNRGAARLFGWGAQEMIGQPMTRCHSPEAVQARYPETLLKAAAECGCAEGEWLCRHRDGTRFRAKFSLLAVPDEEGQVAGYTLSAQDLSEKHEAAAALAHRTHQQMAVAALSQTALAGKDPRLLLEQAVESIMSTCRADLCEIFELQLDGHTLVMQAGAGWEPGRMGVVTADAASGTLLGHVLDSSEPVAVPGQANLSHLRTPHFLQGQPVAGSLWVAFPGRPNSTGLIGVHHRSHGAFEESEVHFLQAVAGVLATAKARKEAEVETGKLAAFPQHNPNPVFEFSRDGLLTYYNDAASRMASSLRLGHTSQMLPPDSARTVQECLDTGSGPREIETRQQGHTLRWTFQPIPEIGRVHLYAVDVTDRLNLEVALQQSQKMEAIGQLAAGVAHDFNNILTVMQGYASRLLNRETLPHSGEEVQEILNATERAAALTRQLLAFSRRQTLERRRFDLREVVSNMARMLQRLIGENIHLELKQPQSLPAVCADSGMMEQILLNLVVNARDAMPRGGTLTVQTASQQIEKVPVRAPAQARAGQYVSLMVRDSGCGMDQETLERIFDPFFTTKGPGRGTGLGLATVYSIVQQHQGWIDVESELNRGTTFTILLPAADGPIETPETRAEIDEATQGGQETVLVVEDEELLRCLARATLEQAGYKVLEAASGPGALQVWQDQQGQVDLLFTDLVMPGGMNGWELCHQLREAKPGLPVVFSSGYGPDSGVAAETEGARGIVYLQKPYRPPALLGTIRKCLDAAASEVVVSG